MLFLARPVFVKGVAVQTSICDNSAEILSFNLQVLTNAKLE